jgi:hypothetical protein
VDRTAIRRQDLIDSVWELCSNNAVEAEAILHGPISMYEAKVRSFIRNNKPPDDKPEPPVKKPTKRGV